MDNFYEQLVTTYKTGKYKAANAMIVILGVVALFALFTALIIPCLLCVAAAVAVFFLKKNFYVEYEYDFTNGEIDIDKIVDLKKRSRVLTFEVKDIELLALENSDYVKDFSNKPERVLNLYPETSESKIYVAMVTGGAERVQVKFVPDEEFINLCYKYNPRAVKKY